MPAADPKTPFPPTTDEIGAEVNCVANPDVVTPKKALALTETTYVVFAVSVRGVVNNATCHPEALSPVNVTVPSEVPDALQSLPVWVPVSRESLK